VQFLPLHVARFVWRSTKKYSRGADSWKRNSCIEMFVSDKHIRAWTAFLEKGSDCLICFEDDAVFRSDSIQRLMALLDELSPSQLDRPLYVDLAGGCSLDALSIQNLEESWDGSFRRYSKPVTNTACAYLLSKPLVAMFVETITRRPWVRLIGIDWMMNKLLMHIADEGVQCACMHSDPTIFKHGTTTGEFVSWQAEPRVEQAAK
jgi:GR25 family glycosyltransferase involved in LPS biosynthesis